MDVCWVLLVTREFQVHMPPELYTSRGQAENEARRWLTVLFGWRPTSKRVTTAGPIRVGDRYAVHLIKFPLPAPWRACPLWIETEWNDRSFPRMRTELLAVDLDEADGRVGNRLAWRGGARARKTEWSSGGHYRYRGRTYYIAAHRVKFADGPWA
jgi:hypothetical protein